ncbi:MAG TPA: thiamine pyrophosphate-dependent dehydrogenase E1 component subunit alpha [Acidimicrobiales bacterium]|nr:thiamine pyrophosphate-dependent dehydrogenase E1 component subunit alpha [Acidimicrobiales bacterium]
MPTDLQTEPVATDPATLVRLYELMALIAATDRRAADEARSGAMKAAFYPVRGLEAVCAAVGVATTADDHLVSTYRNLGDAVAKGVPVERIVAEYFGRSTGTSKGQGGPMHLVDATHGLMATSGIVGGGLPIAVGLGLAAQLDAAAAGGVGSGGGGGTGGSAARGVGGRVVVATFGDGATSIGAFHESLNLAALWNLPVVFVCQNNQWGEHTPIGEYSPVASMARRADAYGMRAVTVDGFDPPATLAAVAAAVAAARAGDGPTLLECVTYRLTPHVATMDMSYMPADALEEARRREPVPAFHQWLVDQGLVTAEALDAADGAAESAVAEAFAAAAAAPPPPPDTMFDDVFADKAMVPVR